MSEEIDDQYEPDEAEAAFVKSDAHAFNGSELQPYTPSRVVAAQAMGLRYPNIGEEALEQFNRTGVYPSAMLDTLIVLWLCTLEKPEQVRRAMRRPDESVEKAITWGAEHGVTDQKSESFWKAYDAFISIVTEIEHSRAVPVETAEAPAEKKTPAQYVIGSVTSRA